MRRPRKNQERNIIIRTALQEDLPSIVAIEELAFGSPWPVSAFQEEMEKSWSEVIVAEDQGEVVGFMIFWNVDPEKHLLNLATDPRRRRRGIGRRLLAHLLDRARQDRALQVILEVRISNRGARSLYASMGFEPVAIRQRYYADNGEDALLMILDLPEIQLFSPTKI